VTVAAARTEGSRSAAAEPGLIAVTVEPTTPTERAALFARVVGMTARETDLLHTLVEGCDTREIAARLHVSEHTVQDHLKSMFAKTGARNRKTVVAWATGGRSSATS
jgi:DNA-binding CsgD family transcriptional regulator